jgi:hypothetical protein
VVTHGHACLGPCFGRRCRGCDRCGAVATGATGGGSPVPWDSLRRVLSNPWLRLSGCHCEPRGTQPKCCLACVGDTKCGAWTFIGVNVAVVAVATRSCRGDRPRPLKRTTLSTLFGTPESDRTGPRYPNSTRRMGMSLPSLRGVFTHRPFVVLWGEVCAFVVGSAL